MRIDVKVELLVILCFLLFCIGMCIGGIIRHNTLYADAIKAGVAKYDARTGEQVWIRGAK